MSRFIKLSNAIWAYNLNAGELQVYAAIANYANRFGCCYVRHSVLAALCNVSVATVARAIRQLQHKGLLCCTQRYNCQGQLTANRYTLSPLRGSFTRVPCEIWAYKLSKSVLCVYLYLLRCRSERSLEAIPSLSQMVSALHMSKRTIVDAVRELENRLLLHKTRYTRQQDNRFGHNRYMVISGILRHYLIALLSAIAGQRKKQTTLCNRIVCPAKKAMLFSTTRIAHAAGKVKDFLCDRAFLLRPFSLFCHKWVGTILIRQ